MDDASPRYLDGVISRSRVVKLSLTGQSLLILDGNSTLADWPYERVFVKEDWVHPTGAILGYKDNLDAGLSIFRENEFKQIQQRLPRRHQASFIISTQYRYLLLMVAGAVAACILLFPAISYMASFLTYLVPQNVEEKLGDQVVSQMEDEFKSCDDKVAIKHLQKISDRLVQATGQKNMTPDIHLFKSTTANAFSLPGHNIAVLSQFLNDAKSENEIAAVMAHEMGHMVKRDSLEAFVSMQGVNIIAGLISSSGSFGGVAEFASFLQSMDYSRKKEFLADDYGAKLLLKAGYSPKGLASFLTRIEKEESAVMGAAMKYVEFLSSHPDTKERVKRILAHGGRDVFKPSLTAAEFQQLKNACRIKEKTEEVPPTPRG